MRLSVHLGLCLAYVLEPFSRSLCRNLGCNFGMPCASLSAPIVTGSYAQAFTWQWDKVSIPCVLVIWMEWVELVGAFVFTKRKDLEHSPNKDAERLGRTYSNGRVNEEGKYVRYEGLTVSGL